MAITNNLLPKCIKGHDTQQAKPNSWEKMGMPEQFIDSIDTTGGELNDAAKFNLLVSSVPSPWARVHLTQHAILAKEDKVFDDPNLMRSPIVRNGKQATVGYCPEAWSDWK